MREPLLPTAVVGSYSMPAWLERVKNDYLLRRISRHDLDEIHDLAVKAAIKDQEVAGVDIVSDGELRRDNMIDHFVLRLPGVQIDHASKKFYYDFYDSVIRTRMPTASLGLVEVVTADTAEQVVVLHPLQPAGYGVAADDGGGEQRLAHSLSPVGWCRESKSSSPGGSGTARSARHSPRGPRRRAAAPR